MSLYPTYYLSVMGVINRANMSAARLQFKKIVSYMTSDRDGFYMKILALYDL
jgi:hypothetical protein